VKTPSPRITPSRLLAEVEGEKRLMPVPRPEDRHRFQQLLQQEPKHSATPEERRKGSGLTKPEEVRRAMPTKHDQVPEPDSEMPSPGARILSAFQQIPEEEPPPSPRTAELGELSRHLAERILVSAPRADDSPQVHIHLKEGILPRTEIILEYRDGRLEIHFRTSDPGAFQVLQSHVDSLQQTLDARLDIQGSVRISVEHAPCEGTDTPKDGRSRNRRRYQDESR